MRSYLTHLVKINWALTLSLVTAFFIFSMILYTSGLNPIKIFSLLFNGSFGGFYEFTETLVKMTPLLLCALAVALPAKLGLLNIGAEGQLLMGAIGCTWVALYWLWLPAFAVLPVMFLMAAVFGGIWGFIPGVLKAALNTNEVIVTILMNFVALFLLEYLIYGPWKDPDSFGWPYTIEFVNNAILATYFNSRVHIVLFIGIFLAIVLFCIFKFTNLGFKSKIIGENVIAAKTAKINTYQYIVFAMLVAGAIAAFAGAGEVSSIQGRLRGDISPGYGYTGFLIAWLANNNFISIILVSLIVGAIIAGGDQLQLDAGLPYSVVEILQGLIFLSIIVGIALKHKFKG
jgi:general nucleoside transport system permease protein